MLRIAESVHLTMVGHCLDGAPLEACGLLAADRTGKVVAVYPTANAEASAKLYSIGPRDYMAAEDAADAAGLSLCGVFHSHTHTEAYPSPTDVERAGIPEWHYVIVSLRGGLPSVRSYRIVDGNIAEEPVVLSR